MKRYTLLFAPAVLAIACGTTGDAPPATTAAATGGAAVSVGVNSGGSAGACTDVVLEAAIETTPVDIVFVIDNSGSMEAEHDAIEQNINENFAYIIQSSGADYQVIVVSDHGPGFPFSGELCIGPPLSGTVGCAGPPVFVPGRFYHYDTRVESLDSMCRMLASMYGSEPDEWNLAPTGWNTWLREEALKVFIEITDDGMSCTFGSLAIHDTQGEHAAIALEQRLMQMNPAQFGYGESRNFVFHSIVGLASKPNPFAPHDPAEPVEYLTCASAVSPGAGYQWLSKRSGGLRFPVCNHQSYDAVFQSIAASVVDIITVPCAIEVPAPPPGQTLDLETVTLLYTPGDGGKTDEWTQVDGPSQCQPGAFYIDETARPLTIQLCPDACSRVEEDAGATVSVSIACGFIPR